MPAGHMEVDSGSLKDKQQGLVPALMEVEHEQVTRHRSHWDSGRLSQKPISILTQNQTPWGFASLSGDWHVSGLSPSVTANGLGSSNRTSLKTRW